MTEGLLLLLLSCAPHTNPPVRRALTWTDSESAALVRRACYDCHSNETVWPWYDVVPIARGLFSSQVEAGRSKLNFSAWDQVNRGAMDATEVVDAGLMPPPAYRRHHPGAQLSESERRMLIIALESALEAQPPVLHRARADQDGGCEISD